MILLQLLLLSLLTALALLDSGLRLLYLLLRRREGPGGPFPETGLRLAAVIVARDEAGLIGEAVRNAQQALESGAEVFVVADHCADETAARAGEAGARVYSRSTGAPGKGAALGWFAAQAGEALRDCEAVVVLDADSRPEAGFGRAAAQALADGAEAAQAFVQGEAPPGAAPALLAAYSEFLAQAVDDSARARLGWPVPLRGTGMILRAPAFLELAPRLCTQVEDAELALLLAARGGRIARASGARVRDPKPGEAAGLARQRGRWLHGQGQLWRRYPREIWRLARRGPAGWTILQAILFRPTTLALAGKVGLAALAWALPGEGAGLGAALSGLLLGAAAVDAAYYALGLLHVPRPGEHARALLRAPLYLLVWLGGLRQARAAGRGWLRARAG